MISFFYIINNVIHCNLIIISSVLNPTRVLRNGQRFVNKGNEPIQIRHYFE